MVAGAAAILDPDAEAHPARLMTLRRASGMLPIAEAFDDLVEPLCKVAVNAAVAQSKRLAQGKQILATKIIGVDPQSPRDHVDLRFRRKARLGSAKAAKRPRRNRVGAHRISARRDCVPTIGTGDAVSGLDHRQRACVRIGAAVELDLALAGGQPPVLRDPRLQYQNPGMFGERQQTFVEAEAKAHRPARLHRQQHEERFHLAEALAAETAADIARMGSGPSNLVDAAQGAKIGSGHTHRTSAKLCDCSGGADIAVLKYGFPQLLLFL